MTRINSRTRPILYTSPMAANPHASEPVFRTVGLTKVYDMGEVQVHALRGVDMELAAGELVVLLDAGRNTRILHRLAQAADHPVLLSFPEGLTSGRCGGWHGPSPS